MAWAKEEVLGDVGADAAGWIEIGRGPTDSFLEAVDLPGDIKN